MKIVITILALFCIQFVFGQLKLVRPTHPNVDLNNTEILVTGTPADTEMEIALSVINVSNQSYAEIACRRTEIDVMPNTSNSTCWVICPPYVDQGVYPVLVVGQQNNLVMTMSAAPGDTLTGFLGHYNPENTDGCSLFLYEWYDVSNPSVALAKVYGRFTHNVNTTCTADVENETGLKLDIFPNPASDILTVQADGNNYTLSVVDLLGKTKYRGIFEGKTKSLDVSQWASGVYFVAVEKNGQIIKTEKVIVRH